MQSDTESEGTPRIYDSDISPSPIYPQISYTMRPSLVNSWKRNTLPLHLSRSPSTYLLNLETENSTIRDRISTRQNQKLKQKILLLQSELYDYQQSKSLIQKQESLIQSLYQEIQTQKTQNENLKKHLNLLQQKGCQKTSEDPVQRIQLNLETVKLKFQNFLGNEIQMVRYRPDPRGYHIPELQRWSATVGPFKNIYFKYAKLRFYDWAFRTPKNAFALTTVCVVMAIFGLSQFQIAMGWSQGPRSPVLRIERSLEMGNWVHDYRRTRGEWNNNFGCWSDQPDCGKDYKIKYRA